MLQVKALLFACVVACAATSLFANVVPNPGFEDANPDGTPVGCMELQDLFRRDPSGGVGGSAALLYENTDTNAHRVLPKIPLPLKVGKAYRIAFKAKCENLVGGKASFCLEWDGEDGKWDNGVYGLRHIGGTTGWTEFEAVTPRFGKGKGNFRFSPIFGKGTVGKAWFDDIVVEELPPHPIESVYSDIYRDIAPSGTVTFTAALNLVDISGGAETAVYEFRFDGANGKPFSRTAALCGDRMSVTVPVDSLAAGRHPVEARVCGADGVTYSDTLLFTRGDPGHRRVYIDSHRRTIVDGKPFFPLGMYWLEVSDEDLALYAKGPFNCLKSYVKYGRDLLDRCHGHGLKVIVSADAYAKRGNVKSKDEEDPLVRSVVDYAKEHPATLAYYVNDENPLSWREDLKRRHDLLAELDPGHPTFSVICQTESTVGYLPTADVFGSDPYPAPGETMWLPMKWMRQKEEGSGRTRALWQVTQTFDKGAYSAPHSTAAKMSTMPSEQDMRCMIWQNIASGANGLFFYSFFDLKKMDWKTPFKESWATVCKLGFEVKRYEDVFLTDEDAPKVKVVGIAPEWLAFKAWRLHGVIYLLAVNGTHAEMPVEFSVEGRFTRAIAEIGSAATVSDGGRVSVKLPPLGVAFMRLVQ